MSRILFILALYFSTAATVTGAVEDNQGNIEEGAKTRPLPLLRNDFILDGADGTIIRSEEEDKWVFIIDSEITDGVAIIEAGQPMDLIPSNTLEGMIANAEETQDKAGLKIWAKVTKYRGKNYLFPWYFIPMTDIPLPEEPKTDQAPQEDAGVSDEKSDDSIIPADVMAMLKPRRVVNLAKLKKILETEGNALLVDRTGFMVTEDGQKVFKLDSLGRNVEDFSFQLLPCEVLEWTEYKISQWAMPQRYRIAGTVTKYKDQYYMLLQRAVRTYSHGNFVR